MRALRFLIGLTAAIIGFVVFLRQSDRAPARPDLVVRSSVPSAEFNDWMMGRYLADHPGVSVGIDGASLLFRLPERLDRSEAGFDVMMTFEAATSDAAPSPRDMELIAVDTIGFAWRQDHPGAPPERTHDVLGAGWEGPLAIGRPMDDELAALWLREAERRVAEGGTVEEGLAALRNLDGNVRAYTDGPSTTVRALVRGDAMVGLLPASLARDVGLEWRAPSDWTLVLELRTFHEDQGRAFVEWLRGEDITAWLDHDVLPAPEPEWLRFWELNVRNARTGTIPDAGGN